MFNPKFKWLTVAIIAVVFLLDCFVPREWSVSRFYLLSILFTVGWNHGKVPILSAAVCTLFTIFNLVIPPYDASWQSAVLSRSIDVFLFWFVAMFVDFTSHSVKEHSKLISDVEQKQSELDVEKTRRESESRFRAYVDSAGDSLFVHGTDGIVLDVNRQACEALGYSREELIGKYPQYFDARYSDSMNSGLSQQLDQGTAFSFDSIHRRKDGTVFPVEVRICPFDTEGRRLALAIARDVTTRLRIEDELRTSEQRFRELADAIPQIVWTASPDGAIDHFNSRAKEYSGISVEQLKGWSWDKVIHPDDLPTTIQMWSETLKSGIPRDIEFRILRHDGLYRWHISRQFAGLAADGSITRWYGTCTDIEEQKQTEAALRSSEQRFSRFMQCVPCHAWIKDLQGRYVFANETWSRTLKRSEESVYGLTDEDLLPHSIATRFRESDRLAMNQPAGLNDIESIEFREGDIRSFLVNKFPIPGRNDDESLIGGMALDVTEQQQAKIELERRKKELNLILDSIPALIFYKDLNHRFVRVNKEFVRSIGIARERFEGKTSADIGSPFSEKYHRDEDEVIASGLPKRSITEPVRTELGTRWLQTDKIPIHDDNGKVTGIVGFSLDITERKIAQEALQESAARIRTIGNHLPDGVLYQIQQWPDGRKRFIDITEGLEELLGVTVEEILADANSLYSLVLPDDASRLEVLEHYSMNRLAVFVFEFRVRARNGQIRWLHCRSTPLLQSDGSVISDGIAIDITDRKLIEAVQARESLIMSNVQDSVIVSDLDGIVTYWNEGATRLFGWQADEMIGRLASERWPEEAQEAGRAMIAEIAAGREVIGELEDYRKDGSRVWIEARVTIFKDSLGRPAGILGVSRDITDRKRMEEELKTSRQRLEYLSRQLITTQESERRHLARELHDEIGQVLTAIKMGLRSTLRTADSVVQPQIEDNMAMVDLAIVQVRNLSLSLRPLQLDELGLVAALHWVVKQQAKIAGFQEHLNVDVGDIEVPSDLSTVCFRIAQEAVTNAVRHGHPRNIHVTLDADNDELFLKIQDDGVGFDVAEANRRASNGTSMGLLSMQERVSLVGGCLSIKSSLGQGTVISVRFPMKPL